MNDASKILSEDVLAVLTFARGNQILTGRRLSIDIDATIINSLDQIPDDSYYEKYDDGRPNWNDIRSCAYADVHKMQLDKWESGFPYSEFLSNLVRELIEIYSKYFVEELLLRGIHDEISGDFCDITYARIVKGLTSSFHETLFKIYKSGGYPCGWEGVYPEGRLIVYYPER